jgi:hypothetical protein
LAGAHPGREFGLRQACAQARLEQLGRDLELRRELGEWSWLHGARIIATP